MLREQKNIASSSKMTNSDVLLTRTRAHIRRATQKLRRTMITAADWPPPTVVFNTELSSDERHYISTKTIQKNQPENTGYDEPHRNSSRLLYCCFQLRRRNRSPEGGDIKNSRLSQILLDTYKRSDHLTAGTHSKKNSVSVKNLVLRTAPDGCLICSDNVDVEMLIAGFREFERRLQYGALMPFANVLPSFTPIRPELIQEKDTEEVSSTLKPMKGNFCGEIREVDEKEACEESSGALC
ncbi:unnamed protein product [Mesocestoides corti]|uniref:Uncharacterized protein n=1 Tax=Mesocestoides corti TaxID=53468 RepID=A0A0R3UGV1_MESCO|nr:unnamed protein product [Mesocestoides corti]